METCYKVFRTSLLQSIPIRSNRFGIEPELTIKIAKRQARVFEVPISYHGRTYEEGNEGPDILDALSGAHNFNRWMADTIRPYLGSEVLELGAGTGNLTRHLAPRRTRYIATDIDPEHLSRLRARLQHRPNVSTALCDLSNEDDFEPFRNRLDSVVCLNVLEHIEDDVTGLTHIYSALRPQGRAVVLVPQGTSVFGTLDTALGHYRRYSKDELRAKMQAAGFHVEHVLEYNRITYPGWYVNGRLLKRRTFSRFQLSIFDRLVPLWRAIDISLPWGPTSIIGIGIRTN
jgi:SAM-dependent methyltransferase